MAEKKITLSKSEIKSLVKDAVAETLTGLGFDIAHPLAVQRDLQYLRAWRDTVDSLKGKTILTAVGIAVIGLCGVLWLGFKALFTVR